MEAEQFITEVRQASNNHLAVINKLLGEYLAGRTTETSILNSSGGLGELLRLSLLYTIKTENTVDSILQDAPMLENIKKMESLQQEKFDTLLEQCSIACGSDKEE